MFLTNKCTVNSIIFLSLLGCQIHPTSKKTSSNESFYTPERSSGALTNPFDWTPLTEERDPFSSFYQVESPNLLCVPEAHGVEEVSVGVWSYSIETDQCHWLTLKQETPFPLFSGDRIQLKIWHFDLYASQPALAHVGLSTHQENIIWVEERIPQESRMLTVEGVLKQDLAQGQWLYFHLDNHGANSWHLLNISLLTHQDKD